ncbi:MAG: ABC transporter substrate-binding protein [Lachnospirales bacterium]
MKKNLFKGVSLVLACSLVLASCSNGTTTTDTSTEGDTATTDATDVQDREATDVETVEANTEAPNPALSREDVSNTFVTTTSAPPAGVFSPAYYTSAYDSNIVSLLFEGLISMNREGEYVPNIAESYEISEDGFTYTFKMKQDVTFSDGTPLTAKDVEATYLILADPTYDGRYVSVVQDMVGFDTFSAEGNTDTTMEGIKVIDDYTISFTFKEALRTNLSNLSMQVMSRDYYGYEKGNLEQVKSLQNQPLGSGRYKLDRFEVDQFVEMSLNENYTLGEQPDFERVVIKAVADALSAEELVAGNIDYVSGEILPEKIETALSQEYIGAAKYPRSGYGYLAMNTRETSPTSDQRVRQALQFGYDGQAFCDAHFQGLAVPQDIPFSQVSWAYTETLQNDLIKYDYDFEKASALLDEAGWIMADDGFRYKDGQKLIVRMPAMPEHAVLDTLVPMLIQEWGELGVEMDITYMEFNSLIEKVQNGDGTDWDIFFMASSWTTPDPNTSRTTWHSDYIGKGMSNYIGYSNPELDALWDEGRTIFDIEEAIPVYEEVGRIINESAAYIVVYANLYHDLYNARLSNVNPHALWSWDSDMTTWEVNNAAQ